MSKSKIQKINDEDKALEEEYQKREAEIKQEFQKKKDAIALARKKELEKLATKKKAPKVSTKKSNDDYKSDIKRAKINKVLYSENLKEGKRNDNKAIKILSDIDSKKYQKALEKHQNLERKLREDTLHQPDPLGPLYYTRPKGKKYQKVTQNLKDILKTYVSVAVDKGLRLYYIGSDMDYTDEYTIMKNLVNRYNIKAYLGSNGKLNKTFMNKVNFTFDWINTKDKHAYIIFSGINNIETEIYLLNVINENTKIIPLTDPRVGDMTRKLLDFVNSMHFEGVLSAALLDRIYRVKSEVSVNNKGVITKVRNYKNKQHRFVTSNGRAYKKIYGQIKLKEVKYVDVNIDHKEYNIRGNCVHSYLNSIYGKKLVSKYLTVKVPTYKDILKFGKKINLSINVYNKYKDKIANFTTFNSKYKEPLSFFIHNDHFFVYETIKNKEQRSMLYGKDIKLSDKDFKIDIDTFNKAENTKFVVTNKILFNYLFSEFKQKYSMVQYNTMSFPIKNNCSIYFDPLYEDKMTVFGDFGHNSDNIYTCIDKEFNLRGFMNKDTFDTFYGSKIIRFYKTNIKDDFRADMVKAYPSMFYGRKFPKPSIADYWRKYNKEQLNKNYFYTVDFNYYDKILHVKNRVIYGECLMYLVNKKCIIKKIKSVFITSQYTCINEDYLVNKDKRIINTEKHFNTMFMTHYTGWLGSTQSDSVCSSTVNSEKEREAIFNQYEKCSLTIEYKDGTEYTQMDGDVSDKKLNYIINRTVTRNKFSTGLLVNFMIKDLVNLELYKFNEKFMKDNPTALLNSLKTDSIGYLLTEEYKDNDFINKDILGKFKIEVYDFNKNKLKFDTIKTKEGIKYEYKEYTTNVICQEETEKINKSPNILKEFNNECDNEIIDIKHKKSKDNKIINNVLKASNHEYKIKDKKIKEENNKDDGIIIEEVINKIDLIVKESDYTHDIKIKYAPSDEINYYDSSKYEELIDDKESFHLYGWAGFGKSHMCINEIIPYLKENNIKFLMASTVTENIVQFIMAGITCSTLQILFHNKSNEEIIKNFKDIKYLIIDEAVQITQLNLMHLEFVKNNTNCNFIMLSDFNQCTIDSYNGIPFIETKFCNKLMDFNILTIKKHKNIRYDEEMYKIILKIIELKDDIKSLREFIYKTFKNKNKQTDSFGICFRRQNYMNIHSTTENVIKTTHSVQGKTLKGNFSIHEIDRMSFRIIYTAVSRATTKNQITIIK